MKVNRKVGCLLQIVLGNTSNRHVTKSTYMICVCVCGGGRVFVYRKQSMGFFCFFVFPLILEKKLIGFK